MEDAVVGSIMIEASLEPLAARTLTSSRSEREANQREKVKDDFGAGKREVKKALSKYM